MIMSEKDKSINNSRKNESRNDINRENSSRNKRIKDKKSARTITKLILIVAIILCICGIIYLVYYFYNIHKIDKEYTELLNNITIDETKVTETKTKRILQLEELQKENTDIVAWLEIEGTNVNYPVLQTTDNDYYMERDYKKEYNRHGSIFLDKDYNWGIPSSNLLLYGHNKNDNKMFGELLNYKKEDFYKKHKNIKFTTLKEESTYEILSIFYSRVYYQNETDVFRYYFFVNAENEEEYDEFVNNAKKVSIYDTGVEAKFGEQLLTLSTCEYSQDNGRFVIVAKKIS